MRFRGLQFLRRFVGCLQRRFTNSFSQRLCWQHPTAKKKHCDTRRVVTLRQARRDATSKVGHREHVVCNRRDTECIICTSRDLPFLGARAQPTKSTYVNTLARLYSLYKIISIESKARCSQWFAVESMANPSLLPPVTVFFGSQRIFFFCRHILKWCWKACRKSGPTSCNAACCFHHSETV